MHNRNFGLNHTKWVCNHCGEKNTGISIKTYVFDGTLLYLCDKCFSKWEERINDMEHSYVKECDYL